MQPTKSGYGLYLEEQNALLQDVYDSIKNMRCTGKTALQIFQKGLLISVTSLRDLLVDMKCKYSDITFILTHKLNQDSLENLFSQLRTRGGLDDHPTPMNALYRLRMMILGKNPGLVQSNTNTVDRAQEEFIVAKVLKSVEVSEEIPKMLVAEDTNTDTLSDCSGSSSFLSNEKLSERDGLQYLAGWVAKKHKKEFPNLGNHTYQLKQSTETPSWIKHLSYGGLMEPSNEWKLNARLLEKYFVKFHGQKFRRENGVTKKMSNLIYKRHPNIPLTIIMTYIKQRLFIRIKYFNMQQSKVLNPKRKSGQPETQVQKKIRKITS